MTVKHSLNIQEVSIINRNQRSITIVNPKDIVPKHFTKVHNEVLDIIKDTCITRSLIVRFHCKIQSSKSCKVIANTVITITSVTLW